MQYEISDIVDIPVIQEMVERLYAASGIPIWMSDTEGKLLLSSGSLELCTQFHWCNPQTKKCCCNTEHYIRDYLAEERNLPECGYIDGQCENGLENIAVPIIIEGQHLATLHLGPFFHEAPDREYFRYRAEQCGLDTKRYLAVLDNVPICSRSKVKEILDYHLCFVDLLAKKVSQKLQWMEAHRALCESETRFRSIFECAASPMIHHVPTG